MIKVTSGVLTEEDKKEINTAKKEMRFRSNLAAFRITNGIRPREFSVVVGQKGNGKSALCKTIAYEAMTDGTSCIVILSEESSAVYKSSINSAMTRYAGDRADPFLETLKITSMLDWPEKYKTTSGFFFVLEEMIKKNKAEMVIFDNFSTSFFGSLPISTQGAAIDNFRRLALVHNVAMIGVFHTAKGTDIYKRPIDGEDVRGNATSTNAGGYNYVLSTYFRAEKPRAILNIDKARYHPEANKTYWELFYDWETGIYTSDKQIDYQSVTQIIDETTKRAKLK